MAKPYISPNLEANRAYIEELLRSNRPMLRFRYMHGRQAGTQGTITPLRFVNDNTVLGIDHSTRTPRSYRIDRMETLSEDEPREEPYRVGDPEEIVRGEEWRRRRQQGQELGVDEQLGLDLRSLRFRPDRRQ